MFSKTVIAGFVLLSVLFASVAAYAEEVTAPKIKEGKVLEENWYNAFLEGKKIGYRYSCVKEAEISGKKVLVFEYVEKHIFKVKGKTLNQEANNMAVVTRDSYEPIYYFDSVKSPGFERSVEASIRHSSFKYELN